MKKTILILIIVIALSASVVALSISHKTAQSDIPILTQNNSLNESAIWNTSNRLFTTANVTSLFQFKGRNGTTSSFTLGVDLTGRKAVGSENSFSALIDVHGLISKSFAPTLISVGVLGWGPNNSYYFPGFDLYGIYEPVASNGWFRNNTSSDFSPLATTNANQTNLTVYTYATLQNVSTGPSSSPYFFSFPIRLVTFAGSLNSTSVVALRYFATLEGVKANVSAVFTIMLTVNQ